MRYLIPVLLLFLVACRSQSAPNVEATVQAAIAATNAAQPTVAPTPFPTATSESTNTPTSTATSNPTPTKRATATPKPYQPLFTDIEPLGCQQDEFQKITWCSKYYTDDIEDYVLSQTEPSVDVAVYVGLKGTESLLRWDIGYAGDDWIFIDEIILLIDGTPHQVPVDEYENIDTDICCGGVVFEYFDRLIDDPWLLMQIVSSDESKVRLSGEGGHIDHVLTQREIVIIGRALATYEQNGGRIKPSS